MVVAPFSVFSSGEGAQSALDQGQHFQRDILHLPTQRQGHFQCPPGAFHLSKIAVHLSQIDSESRFEARRLPSLCSHPPRFKQFDGGSQFGYHYFCHAARQVCRQARGGRSGGEVRADGVPVVPLDKGSVARLKMGDGSTAVLIRRVSQFPSQHGRCRLEEFLSVVRQVDVFKGSWISHLFPPFPETAPTGVPVPDCLARCQLIRCHSSLHRGASFSRLPFLRLAFREEGGRWVFSKRRTCWQETFPLDRREQ
jgi:hypothetical protein